MTAAPIVEYTAADQLPGTTGDWKAPPSRLFMCPPPDERPADPVCDCGYQGPWLMRTWRHELTGGVDEQCPSCGDIERYERHHDGHHLVAVVATAPAACAHCGRPADPGTTCPPETSTGGPDTP